MGVVNNSFHDFGYIPVFKISFNKKSNEQKNIPEILKDESVIIEDFQKQGNPSHFNSNFKKEIENQFLLFNIVLKIFVRQFISENPLYVNDSFHDFGYIPVFKITLNIFI
jgi:hypothetical protein